MIAILKRLAAIVGTILFGGLTLVNVASNTFGVFQFVADPQSKMTEVQKVFVWLLSTPWWVPGTLMAGFAAWLMYITRPAPIPVGPAAGAVPQKVKPPIPAPRPVSPQFPILNPPAPPPRQLSAYEVETKLRVIDAALAFLKDKMEPTVKDGPRLQSGWWNALAAPQHKPGYKEELTAYRNTIKTNLNDLDKFRDNNVLYQDIIRIVQQTYWDKVLPPVEKMMQAYGFLSDVWKPGLSHEGCNFIMSPYVDDFGRAIEVFNSWRGIALNNLMDLRRSLSQ